MVKKLYEGMFLVDSADAASDWDGVVETVKTILDRAGAEVVSLKKWDERKLAYDINGKSRGTYLLSYFRVDGSKIAGIERDVQLNERVMRVLVLNAEHMTQEDINKATPAELAEKGVVKRDEEEVAAPKVHERDYGDVKEEELETESEEEPDLSESEEIAEEDEEEEESSEADDIDDKGEDEGEEKE